MRIFSPRLNFLDCLCGYRRGLIWWCFVGRKLTFFLRVALRLVVVVFFTSSSSLCLLWMILSFRAARLFGKPNQIKKHKHFDKLPRRLRGPFSRCVFCCVSFRGRTLSIIYESEDLRLRQTSLDYFFVSSRERIRETISTGRGARSSTDSAVTAQRSPIKTSENLISSPRRDFFFFSRRSNLWAIGRCINKSKKLDWKRETKIHRAGLSGSASKRMTN